MAIMLALATAALGACASSDDRSPSEPGTGGTNDSSDDRTAGGTDDPGNDITDAAMTPAMAPDAAVSCRPNPEADPECPEICPELCNAKDDDCDGIIDEGADSTDCDASHATSTCVAAGAS